MAPRDTQINQPVALQAQPVPAQPNYKVLIISPVFPPVVSVGGGVAITCGALTDKLIMKGCTVKVLSPRLDNVDWGTSSLYKAFPVMLPTLYNLKTWWNEIKDADVVVAPDNSALIFLLTFSHYHGVPFHFNLHTNVRHLLEMTGWFGRWVSAPICDGFIRSASNLTARTFTTSQSYAEVLRKRGYRVDGVFSPKIKLSVFENNDTAEEIAEARKWLVEGKDIGDRKVLIFVGRFSHEKSIPLLVDALPESCVLAIVGDGPDPEGGKVKDLHDPDNFVFVHRGIVNQDRLRVLYKASDFLVSASSFETLGMTVIEANVCGIPVIVQNATGFNTQVIHGENGFLIDYSDAKTAKSEIEYCIKNRPTQEQIQNAINSDSFWFSKLPNLDDEVMKLIQIGSDKSKWGSGPISLIIMFTVCIVTYFSYWIIGYPFNKVTDWVDRKNPVGPAVFNAQRMAPKGGSNKLKN